VYKPFSEEVPEWHMALKKGENAECLASGTGWAAVYTNQGLIRVFSTTGIQKYVISQGLPILTMVGYENLLGVIYHQGPPVLGYQSTRVKILDISKQMMQLMDIDFPVSRYQTLQWADFSEEGQLFTFDTDG
jgi:chromosome transmission fidelity protein 4